ncbi:MAG: class I SAM-dependent methyltransferase [Anaerolineae bacterium]|nr:class I SAM-dependent methyltransferase [Anaerolineae bacterium]MCI0610577.1 class I SAM-dependent methyltransferase [Anaerolineae bacterium]
MDRQNTPPICNYEDSDYQTSFWDKGGREYEDRTEAIALKRLLPNSGRLLLELGAGAGRNTPRYAGFERIVLLDYSRTQLEQAQQRLGSSDKYIYVAADVYRLPFVDGLFDAATMIRTLHHMADAPKALGQVKNVLGSGGVFILEFANKQNLKAIFRYLIGKQNWNPFTLEPVEFAKLNFDFHPKAVRGWLRNLEFKIEKTLTVSYFRVGFLKRVVPTGILVFFDSLFQWTGALWQFTPSVFVKARVAQDAVLTGEAVSKDAILSYFKCPNCGHSPLVEQHHYLECTNCKAKWEIKDGIYDFREPLK